MIFKKDKKRGFDYFGALVKMSEYALEEARFLKEILADFKPDELDANRLRMHAFEHDCDTVKHSLTTALVKDFLPPVDRDDLFRLSHVTDNLTDSVENIAVFLYMADIKKLRSDVGSFVDLTIECCENTVKMLREFENFKKPTKLNEYVVVLNDLEEQGDRLYTDAVRKLSAESEDVREIIEWRDVYKIFETTYDAAESIADNIEAIVLKNS